MKKITPRIPDPTAEFIPATFSSMNAGAEFILAAFPGLYRQTLVREVMGKLSENELMIVIDVFNMTELLPGLSGRTLRLTVENGINLGKTQDSLAWSVLLDKLERLTLFQAACLEIWAAGFWLKDSQDFNDYVKPLL